MSGWTWLATFNFLVAQWLLVRVARIEGPCGETWGWGVLGPVAPLSGWWGRYVPRCPKLRARCAWKERKQ